MKYPLVSGELLSGLRLFHGLYNTVVIALFLYHGWTGVSIRRARKSGKPLPFAVIRRHRKLGPILAGMGVLGFFIGFSTVILHTGNVLEYPGHLFTGVAIVMLLLITAFLSRRIKGQDSPYRTPHLIIGCSILCLYLVQMILGIGVLL